MVCLSFTGMAREAYYWSDDKTFELAEDRTAIALHFQPGFMPSGLNQLTGQFSIQSVDIHPFHHRAILFLGEGWSGSAADFAAFAGLQNSALRSAEFGFKNTEGTRMWLTHEVVLQLQPGMDFSAYADLFEQFNARFSRYRYETAVLDVEQPFDALLLANAMFERGGTRWAHPDFYSPIQHMSDPLYPQQFQMNNTGQVIDGFTSLVDIDINAPQAWAITTGNPSMIVAVIDDGVEAHEDMRTAGGVSRVLSGFTPATGGTGLPVSGGAHGQACAGIIAASHNTIGVKGVAPEVQIVPVNIFVGGESTQDLADALTYAKNSGAAVISNSWGYPGSCSLNYSTLTNAINDAANNGRGGLGCVVVFAAGNSYGSCVDYPAYLSNVIAVGAVTNLGARSNYSNQGTALDVVAPSNPAPGQSGAGVRTIDRMGGAGYSSGNYTTSFGGTSAACPAVAGVAALVLAVDPAATSSSVRTTISSTATDMGSPGFDNSFGFGRVNAFAAVSGVSSPTVSFNGQVNDLNTGAALSGVQVRYDGPGGSFSTTTNASGSYSLSGLIDGGFYLIYLGKWGHEPLVDAASVVDGGNKNSFMTAGYGDDFEFNFGWTATGTASTGMWVRDIPIGTTFSGFVCNPDVDSDDQGSRCYVTGNGGGGAGNDDVDNGTVILTSPVFDLSGYTDPYVSYARWFFNDGGSGTPDDQLVIRLSNGSVTVPVENIGGSGIVRTGWVYSNIRVSDFITPSNNMRLIVETSDLTIGHLVEAGFDKFRAVDSAAVSAPCANAPSGMNSTILSNGVLLSWASMAAEGAAAYTVSGRRAGSSGAFKSLPVVFEPNTSRLVPENKLRPGFSYEWKVQADCGSGILSPESSLTVFTWPGLRQTSLSLSTLQPNPATDQVQLTYTGSGVPSQLSLIDVSGRVLHSRLLPTTEGPSTELIDVSHLDAGMYLLEIRQAEDRQTFELIIAR